MMPSAAEMSGAAAAVVRRPLFTKALTSLMKAWSVAIASAVSPALGSPAPLAAWR
jgi:hypothetical protein